MELIYLVATLLGVVLLVMVWSLIHNNNRQQLTIERLTNKLMAKDYGEYKRHEKIVEREETPKRKPMSYHDDNSIDLED